MKEIIIREDAITMALQKDDTGKWHVGVSVKAPEDNFNRKKGNLIARGRLRKALENDVEVYAPRTKYFTLQDAITMIPKTIKQAEKILEKIEEGRKL